MKFTKMQGIGNDYIYVNGQEERVDDPAELTRRISDRHFGVGSDGLVIITPLGNAEFTMTMYNADGSEGKMCGNAARCIGKYVYERGLTDQQTVTLHTRSGLRILELDVAEGLVRSVRVNMGAPELRPELIPVRCAGERAIAMPLEVGGERYELTCVSMGNPHAVMFVDDPDTFDVHGVGRSIETHPAFPEQVNVEFVRVIDRRHLRMRVWERGSGETMACGTGACAALVAAVLTGRAEREAVLTLNGGDLKVYWDEKSNQVYQEGSAAFVCDGVWLG